MVKVYYHDNEEGDCRLPHNSGDELTTSELAAVGVLYYSYPIDAADSEAGVAALAEKRNYKNKDVITVAPSVMGEAYESKIDMFFREHMHEDEEIRYILDGKGYFDVRSKGDRWIRIQMEAGDLIVLPAGIYHRFTVDTDNVSGQLNSLTRITMGCVSDVWGVSLTDNEMQYIKATRLFQDEPKWEALPRSEKTDANLHRQSYITARG